MDTEAAVAGNQLDGGRFVPVDRVGVFRTAGGKIEQGFVELGHPLAGPSRNGS